MSSTTEIRDEVFAEQLPSLRIVQAVVLVHLQNHGPCTTRQLAERSKVSIFTVRPRVCELVDLGMAELVGREGREGVYAAVSSEDLAAKLAEEGSKRTGPIQEELL